MLNMNLSNCILFSELYHIDLSNVNTNHLSKNQKKYCKKKFKFDFEFIENKKYDKKYSKLYHRCHKAYQQRAEPRKSSRRKSLTHTNFIKQKPATPQKG